jgi:hypothetical protein
VEPDARGPTTGNRADGSSKCGLTRPDVRVRREPVEAVRLEVSSKAFCNAAGVAPAKEPIPRH